MELIEKYRLERYQGCWSRGTWQTALGTLDVLDRVPKRFLGRESANGAARVLDVGSSHWSYVGALAAWVREAGIENASLTGIELDAYRIYRNLRTPAALARYHAGVARADVRDIRYVEGSVEAMSGEVDWVTWLFPFLFKGTVRAWGLPASKLRPETLAKSVFRRISPSGFCIFLNQGEKESGALEEVLARAVPRAACAWSERITESLHAAEHPLFVSLWLVRPVEGLDP